MTFSAKKTTIRTAALALLSVTALAGCGSQVPEGSQQANLQLPKPTSTSVAPAPSTSTSTATPTTTKPVSRQKAAASVATTRVVKKNRTVEFGTDRKTSDDLAKGKTKVTREGVNGTAVVTVRETLIDGKVVKTKVLDTDVTKAAVDRVLVVGTKTSAPAERKSAPKPTPSEEPKPSGKGIDMRRASMWDRIAQCESGGNWSINTGNGYYGGLQFNLQTWRGAGGGDFASRPDLASRAEQITVANRVYDDRGSSAWGCA
ncbi:resuscitation-promoting factor [Luteipulveratus mongoliensis]|uniref:resuscitation-promoting factor n=1 Tax=Luteipulveratus mongoliensis TaxID=571913 RepID=UPI000A718A07|nr:resuscitation-promoting factor [Luteipulveratus mongoliensis]